LPIETSPNTAATQLLGNFFSLSSAINEGINHHGLGNDGIFVDHDERTIIGWQVSLVVVSLKDSVKIRLKARLRTHFTEISTGTQQPLPN
jgi:hypothetical protein